MAGKTPAEAYRRYRDPLETALGCITPGRLSVPPTSRFEVGRLYAVALNDGVPVMLKGVKGLTFSAGQTFRIVPASDDRSPFNVQTVEYAYVFEITTVDARHEILAFHWTPEEQGKGYRTYPHLHIGSAMIAPSAPLLPRRFNKLHIPTSRVALESVVRFAIEEIGVTPRAKDWSRILDRTQEAFETGRTRTG